MRLPMLFAAVALAGCQTTAQEGPRHSGLSAGEPIALTASQTTAAEQGVASALKDPESARFANMRAARKADGVIVACGYVNARNSFGGYVGNRPFIGSFIGNSFGLAYLAQDATQTEAVLIGCRDQGTPLTSS